MYELAAKRAGNGAGNNGLKLQKEQVKLDLRGKKKIIIVEDRIANTGCPGTRRDICTGEFLEQDSGNLVVWFRYVLSSCGAGEQTNWGAHLTSAVNALGGLLWDHHLLVAGM